MALVFVDRVKETTTTTGTGTYTLGGAYTGFQAFSTIGDGNTCYYCATDDTNWEVGIGTYTLAGTLLARTSVLASSNAGAAVSWAAGTKSIFNDVAASRITTLLTYNNTATISKGFTLTPNSIGTFGSFTIDPSLGNYQYGTNNAAFTLTAPTSDCAIDLLVTNGATAGAITFSGFTVGSATGSALTTTNTNKFLISIRRINAISTYSIYALQ